MRYVYRPFKPTYRATLCGVTFGPDEGQVKPGEVVEMDPNDEQFQDWNAHVSGADGGPCFVPADLPPVTAPAPAPAPKAKGKPKAEAPAPTPADPAVELT